MHQNCKIVQSEKSIVWKSKVPEKNGDGIEIICYFKCGFVCVPILFEIAKLKTWSNIWR